MTRARWLGLGLGLVLIAMAFGLVVWQEQNQAGSGVAFAQTNATPTPTFESSATAVPQPTTVPAVTAVPGATTTPAANTQQNIGATFWSKLAAKLGVSESDLRAKALEARQEMIDEAVAADRVSPADADRIKGQLNVDDFIQPIPLGPNRGQLAPQLPQRVPGPFNNRMPNSLFGTGILRWFGSLETVSAVAETVNLTPAQLLQELRNGKTLADVVRQQNADENRVKQAIVDAQNAAIDQALQFGFVTQQQAAQLKALNTLDSIDLSQYTWAGMGMWR